MKQIIDIETWERRDNYNFFRNFVSSWYSITTEIDCTEASLAARAAGRSFFLYYLYAVLRSANEVDELRFRKDKNGQVVFHDRVDIISPIAVPGKTFYTIRIPYHEDFNRRFLIRVREMYPGNEQKVKKMAILMEPRSISRSKAITM